MDGGGPCLRRRCSAQPYERRGALGDPASRPPAIRGRPKRRGSRRSRHDSQDQWVPRAGIVLHRSTTLIARHCTRNDGIAVTTPGRTLADLRPLLSPAQFSAAVREAEFLRLPIDDRIKSDRARTDLEQAMLALCRRHRLPRPQVNVKIEQFEVDFLWRAERLVVEVDGWESHRTRSAFEQDRARDARLAVLGYEVIRFTWRQLTGQTAQVARTIRSLLRARSV